MHLMDISDGDGREEDQGGSNKIMERKVLNVEKKYQSAHRRRLMVSLLGTPKRALPNTFAVTLKNIKIIERERHISLDPYQGNRIQRKHGQLPCAHGLFIEV